MLANCATAALYVRTNYQISRDWNVALVQSRQWPYDVLAVARKELEKISLHSSDVACLNMRT